MISFDGGGRPQRYKPICRISVISVISDPAPRQIIALCVGRRTSSLGQWCRRSYRELKGRRSRSSGEKKTKNDIPNVTVNIIKRPNHGGSVKTQPTVAQDKTLRSRVPGGCNTPIRINWRSRARPRSDVITNGIRRRRCFAPCILYIYDRSENRRRRVKTKTKKKTKRTFSTDGKAFFLFRIVVTSYVTRSRTVRRSFRTARRRRDVWKTPKTDRRGQIDSRGDRTISVAGETLLRRLLRLRSLLCVLACNTRTHTHTHTNTISAQPPPPSHIDYNRRYIHCTVRFSSLCSQVIKTTK